MVQIGYLLMDPALSLQTNKIRYSQTENISIDSKTCYDVVVRSFSTILSVLLKLFLKATCLRALHIEFRIRASNNFCPSSICILS